MGLIDPMSFSVKCYVDDQALTVTTETAQEAFARAIEWHVAERFSDVSISDGIKSYSIDEFSLVIANLRQS